MHLWHRAAVVFENYFCILRPEPNKRRFAAITWLLYMFVTLLVGASHEGWFDEAQAWLMARELSPLDLTIYYSRYEGTPPLWHYILMIPAKAGLDFSLLQLVSGGIASIGVWLLLRKSPFPHGFRILLPFTFFLFYQYSVVARNYCLIWPALACLALVYPERWKRPAWYLLTLGFIAGISLHTALLAGGLVLLDFIGLVRGWTGLDAKDRRARLGVFLGFGLLTCLIVFINYPPADLSTRSGGTVSLAKFFANNRLMLAEGLTGETYSSLLLLGAVTWWAAKTEQAGLILVPLGLLSLLFGLHYANLWHSGIVFCWILFGLWTSSASQKRWPTWFALALLGMTGVQIAGGIRTARFDLIHPYSGAGAAATSLAPLLQEGKSISGYGFSAHGVLAYLPPGAVKFSNVKPPRHDFYLWNPDSIPLLPPPIIRGRTDLLLISHYSNREEPFDVTGGYRIVAAHPGYSCWKGRIYEHITYYIMERVPRPSEAADSVPPKT